MKSLQGLPKIYYWAWLNAHAVFAGSIRMHAPAQCPREAFVAPASLTSWVSFTI
jgi:hypothetical protein